MGAVAKEWTDAEKQRREEALELVDEKNWPIPKWFGGGGAADRTQSFEAYFAHKLRTRYLELQGDFKTVVGNFPPHDMPTARAILRYLQAARAALEEKRPDLLTASSTLDLVERYMVWLYPTHIIETRLTSTRLLLETVRPPGWETYRDLLSTPFENLEKARAPLDEAINACNQHILSERIGSGLQIKRLRAFRLAGTLMLLLFFATVPLAVARDSTTRWPTESLNLGPPFVQWLNALSVLVVGMLGGFLSGLLQARSSKVTLGDYQETMLKLALRPMVGGIIALVLFILLSWRVISAISVDNAGSFLLVAFVSGFSERYFLKLLDLPGEEVGVAANPVPAPKIDAPAGAPPDEPEAR